MTTGTDTLRTAPPTAAPPAAAPPAAAPSRLGPFEILGRLAGREAAGQVTLSVKGSEGTPLVGRDGVARCLSAPSDPLERERLAARLVDLAGLRHPAIAGPIHTGLSGGLAYVVDEPPPTPRSSPETGGGALAPSLVADYLLTISSALETAHRADLSHGELSRATVVIGDDGPVIGGWGVVGQGAAEDQRGLAALVVDWLAASPFVDDPSLPGSREQRHERLRRHLDQTTDRLVFVLTNALAPEPAERYPSVTDFVAAFQEAVTRSAEELVHAGFEAISARTPEIARFMAVSAARYAPDAPGLDLLTLQLAALHVPGGAVGIPGSSAGGPPLDPASAFQARTPAVMAGLDPALTAGIPPEMLAMIAPPIPVTEKPRNNPWLVMIVAIGGLTLLLLVGIAIVLFAGSS